MGEVLAEILRTGNSAAIWERMLPLDDFWQICDLAKLEALQETMDSLNPCSVSGPVAMDEIRALSPIAILGYGINAESLKRAMAMEPSMIGVDAGSTDCGAYYLGTGQMYQSRKSMKRDLGLLLGAARGQQIPLIIGSAGLAGSRPHVAWTVDILGEVAREKGLRFRLAVIYADQEEDLSEEGPEGRPSRALYGRAGPHAMPRSTPAVPWSLKWGPNH